MVVFMWHPAFLHIERDIPDYRDVPQGSQYRRYEMLLHAEISYEDRQCNDAYVYTVSQTAFKALQTAFALDNGFIRNTVDYRRVLF